MSNDEVQGLGTPANPFAKVLSSIAANEGVSGQIHSGDVVMLKSGGPQMTVGRIGELDTNHAGLLQCSWFIDSEYRAEWFTREQLNKVR